MTRQAQATPNRRLKILLRVLCGCVLLALTLSVTGLVDRIQEWRSRHKEQELIARGQFLWEMKSRFRYELDPANLASIKAELKRLLTQSNPHKRRYVAAVVDGSLYVAEEPNYPSERVNTLRPDGSVTCVRMGEDGNLLDHVLHSAANSMPSPK